MHPRIADQRPFVAVMTAAMKPPTSLPLLSLFRAFVRRPQRGMHVALLLMFAVGAGSLGWMLALGAVMAAEKNLPWGRRLTVPLGLLLLAWSAALVLERTLV